MDAAREALQQLCADLRRLWLEAGGPSVRALAGRIGLGKSQTGAILNGRIRQPPDWSVVHGLLTCVVRYAQEHGHAGQLTLSTAVDEYWRSRHALVEQAFVQVRHAPAVRTPERAGTARRPPDWTPRQLPAPVPDFTGRESELAALTGFMHETAEPSRGAVVTAVSGTAGVGKTALAVEWGHRHAGWFPDGQLYVNLRGFDPSGNVVAPATAVRGFLDALGVPAQRIPADPDAQAALYRSLLAHKRMLIVLDNARDTAQVRPLLPAAPGCRVIETSRNQLTSLIASPGAHLIALDLLTPGEARQLLAHRVGADRITAEPDAVDEIIARCTRLPLALAVVAAQAATRPRTSLRALADELRNSRLRWQTLAGDEPSSDVRAVFSWSYQALGHDAARLFRLLGLHPGPDITASAAASTSGLPQAQVRPLLAELATASIVAEHEPGRFALHDLLRAYAGQISRFTDTEGIRHAAVHRVLDHYLHTAYTADRLLNPARDPITLAPPQPGVTPEHLRDHRQALDWFGTERAVVIAAVDHAAATGFETHVWQLAWTLQTFLNRQGRWHDQSRIGRTALAAAERLGDPDAQALTHRHLAHAHTQLGRLDDSHTHLALALDLYRQAGDQAGQARTHLTVGYLWQRRSDLAQALGNAEQALRLYRAAGHEAGEANALNQVGWYHAQLGDYERALAACLEAVALQEKLGDRDTQAHTWDTLGYAHHRLGHHVQALACYHCALALHREFGDRYNEADVLTHLGDAHHATGDHATARDAYQQAMAILTDLGHPDAKTVHGKLVALGDIWPHR